MLRCIALPKSSKGSKFHLLLCTGHSFTGLPVIDGLPTGPIFDVLVASPLTHLIRDETLPRNERNLRECTKSVGYAPEIAKAVA